MGQGTILFADNDEAFLNTRKESLERTGYQVFTASNPVQARQMLVDEHLDLAILDIRLKDDNDDKDVSGLTLAQEVAPFVPKIMLTQFPSVFYVQEALNSLAPGGAPAVAFVVKDEGSEALLHAIQTVLRQNVFIGHGHDKAAKEAVTFFIKSLNLRPILLEEQTSTGRTIIDMFEDHSNVAFAVMLLTPDDVGGSQQGAEEVGLRARQNVILELGYFIGKIGRSKVSILCKEGVEIPSQLHGIRCLRMDSDDGWKRQLAQEMRGVGMNIDLNRVR